MRFLNYPNLQAIKGYYGTGKQKDLIRSLIIICYYSSLVEIIIIDLCRVSPEGAS